ncbi:hypothetical protein [Pseudomonas mangiferae]|uniref:Uncharacterized protein n=1 Tax=Pseudomonas mangiferae TaxID=2593654 RepID=A0A553GVW7_9PSED|nr:hypothetical protein [Pseudomonas mangiferae]TRX73662.1 hypothetical protein FM069_16135 [Pseudomonas mangiferae]
MREALGLTPAIAVAPKQKPRSRATYTLVELSVRKKTGGAPFRFQHRSSSISKLTAQLEAEKAARKKGLDVWVVLDIQQISE